VGKCRCRCRCGGNGCKFLKSLKKAFVASLDLFSQSTDTLGLFFLLAPRFFEVRTQAAQLG
jgi:hypothetical protein